MAFFKRDKETPQPGEEGPGPDLKALSARFREARFGDSCRTLPFTHPSETPGVSEWLKAFEDPLDRSWYIFSVKRDNSYLTEDAPEGRAADFHKPVASDLTMFDMVRHLSEYETGQRKLGYNVTEDIADRLGTQYYRAFAEREGIVFDLRAGEPHPTLNGTIATAGHFAPGAEEKARASFTVPDFAAFEKSRATAPFNEKDYEDSLAALLASFDRVKKFDFFLRDLASMQAIITDYYNESYTHSAVEPAKMAALFKMSPADFDACQAASRAVPAAQQAERGYNFSGFCFYWLAKRAEETLRDSLADETQVERILPGLQRMSLYFEMFRANAYIRLICDNHPANEELVRFQRDALYKIDKTATALGYDDAAVMTLKKMALSRAPLAPPQEMADFVAACKKLPGLLEEQIEAQRTRLAGPKPAAQAQRLAAPKP